MKSVDRFIAIHNEAVASKDTSKMLVADMVMRKAIERLARYDEREVEDLADMYDGSINYNNFLTEKEAKDIVSKFINFDDTTGAKWSSDTFFNKVKELGVEIDKKPYYNKWALWAEVNNIISDAGKDITKYANGDPNLIAAMTYDFAVSKLSDKDKPYFVRWYFGLK